MRTVGWDQEIIVFGLQILQTLLEMVLKLDDLMEVKGIQHNSAFKLLKQTTVEIK